MLSNGSLLVACRGREEEGRYQCRAENRLAIIDQTVSLDVQGRRILNRTGRAMVTNHSICLPSSIQQILILLYSVLYCILMADLLCFMKFRNAKYSIVQQTILIIKWRTKRENAPIKLINITYQPVRYYINYYSCMFVVCFYNEQFI